MGSKEQQTTKPKYLIGQIVAGSLFAGTIQSAFFTDGEWSYGIGDNASTEPTEKDNKILGYRIGPKFIKESDIKWWQNMAGEEWEDL